MLVFIAGDSDPSARSVHSGEVIIKRVQLNSVHVRKRAPRASNVQRCGATAVLVLQEELFSSNPSGFSYFPSELRPVGVKVVLI